MSKQLCITPYNGGFVVWWQRDGWKEWESLHATREDAEAHVNELVKDYGYERIE